MPPTTLSIPRRRYANARDAANPYPPGGGRARAPVHEHRRRGADIYMKGGLRADEGYPSVFYCDIKHSKVASRHVRLLPGLNDALARSSTIDQFDQFDRMAVDRVFNFNIAIAIYWAQRKLKRKLIIEAGQYREAYEYLPHEEDFSTYSTKRVRTHTHANTMPGRAARAAPAAVRFDAWTSFADVPRRFRKKLDHLIDELADANKNDQYADNDNRTKFIDVLPARAPTRGSCTVPRYDQQRLGQPWTC